MFSRNRFNGQHGAGVAPKGGAKPKVHLPKKRAPNPKVALVIRGKIHRLLQGSAEPHVPDSLLHHAAAEEEDEGGPCCSLPQLPRAPSRSPSCVGEAELNREGCMKMPCSLRRRSRGPTQVRHISFESGLRDAPERTPLYSPPSPDLNGNRLHGGRDLSPPRGRPKRPYSAGDCLDCSFNRTPPQPLCEDDREAASSAVIEHILKELRGINKIQEEISDLRDYLTSVRGSVEEVSSCVDAVLLEIEGMRSSSRAGSVTRVDSWSEPGSARRRPVSAHSTLGRAGPNTDVNGLPTAHRQRHSVHGEVGAEELAVSPAQESMEEQDDTSEQSSDIPDAYLTGKLGSTYLEQRDCPSPSSLSSGHSSKSESDLERPSSSHEPKPHGDRQERWADVLPPRRVHVDPAWPRNGPDGWSGPPRGGGGSWEHPGAAGGPPMGSSEPGSNCPANRRQEEGNRPLRRSRSRPPDLSNLQADGCECGADVSLPQSSGYHSRLTADAEDSDLQQTSDLSFSTSWETCFPPGEASGGGWSETCFSAAADGALILNQNCADRVPEGAPPEGFAVKRFGRAVLGFSSALRGALRKLEVPPAEGKTDFPAEERWEELGEEPSYGGAGAPGEVTWNGVSRPSAVIRRVDSVCEGHPGSEGPVAASDQPVPVEEPAELQDQLSPAGHLFAQESSDLEEAGPTEPGPGVEAEGRVEERRLTGLRSFQQVLRDKRETKRDLLGRSMSSSSQNDLGSSESGAAQPESRSKRQSLVQLNLLSSSDELLLRSHLVN